MQAAAAGAAAGLERLLGLRLGLMALCAMHQAVRNTPLVDYTMLDQLCRIARLMGGCCGPAGTATCVLCPPASICLSFGAMTSWHF
jgi:hypothetical protein